MKNPLANAEGLRDEGWIPGLGRSPGGGHGNPLQYSRLEGPKTETAEPARLQSMGSQSRTQLKRLSTQHIADLQYHVSPRRPALESKVSRELDTTYRLNHSHIYVCVCIYI